LTLCKTLLTNLDAWSMEMQPEPRPSSTPMGDEQIRIGWDRLLDGWLSQYWRSQQDKIWSQVCSHKSSCQWTSVLIQKLWDILWDMWDYHNKELHSGELDQQQILHSAAEDQIGMTYKRGAQQLPHNVLHLIHTPKEMVLQYPLELKHLWLASVHVAQQQWKTHKFGRYHSKQRFMVTWLQTAAQQKMANNT